MTRSWSDLDTSTSISRWRFRLLVFFVKMCRACEWPRLIFPVAVRRTRFAAPLCVLSFGIDTFLLNFVLCAYALSLELQSTKYQAQSAHCVCMGDSAFAPPPLLCLFGPRMMNI